MNEPYYPPLKKLASNIDAFDVAKLLLSIFVVAIHAQLLPELLNPLFRVAVPLFVMMSGFLLFGKLGRAEGESAKRRQLLLFIKRNLFLYMFWFIVLLPLTIYARK